MKIGVLADTHVPDIFPQIPPRVLELLNGVDIILHVGDICDLNLLQQLEPIAQTFAVYGEQDSSEVKKYLQEKQRLEFAGRSVGLVHGNQAWEGDWFTRTLFRFSRARRVNALHSYILREFPDVDVAVFGHSHEPYVKMHGGVLLFNPGSVIPPLGQAGSIGMLEITPNSIKGKIIPL
jgi:putative phosphoesterase